MSDCSFTVVFEPVGVGFFTDTFDIPLTQMGFNYIVTVQGEGVTGGPEADIAISGSRINFGVRNILPPDSAPYQTSVVISNTGSEVLTIESVALTGDSSNEFSLNGCVSGTSLMPSEFCVLDVLFLPVVDGVKLSAIEIVSNDPDESLFTLPIISRAVADNDGIEGDVEDKVVNSGDGNFDGIPDSYQGNVASFRTLSGRDITLVAPENVAIQKVVLSPQEKYSLPEGINLGEGVLEFALANLGGEQTNLGIIMPPDVMFGKFYVLGAEQDPSSANWFDFSYDGATGAVVLGSAEFVNNSGVSFRRSIANLRLGDAQRGDNTATTDGRITVIVGFETKYASSGGVFSVATFLFITLVLALRVYMSMPDAFGVAEM